MTDGFGVMMKKKRLDIQRDAQDNEKKNKKVIADKIKGCIFAARKRGKEGARDLRERSLKA